MTPIRWRSTGISSVLVALFFCWQTAAQNPGGSQPPGTTPGSGPYKAVMEMDAGLRDHTIYRPDNLSAVSGGSLPIVVWGNGACVDVGNAFSSFLTDISSYGYLVIALGPIVQRDTAGPAQPPAQPGAAPLPPQSADSTEPPRGLPPAATHPSQMIDAIQWATAENARAESKYYKRLNAGKIAVMGQSCGGVQAIEVAADRRISTAVFWNSGLFGKPTNLGGRKTLSKQDLESIHVPVAYISGDPQDIAFKNAEADFDSLTKVPAFRAYERGVGHGGTYRQPNGGEFSGIGVGWLNWQLKGDQRAALMFRGADCGLCVNPKWVVRTKNIK